MSAREAFWAMGPLVLLLGGLAAFRRVRGRTDDDRHTVIYKQRLPLWVGRFETTAFCVLMAPVLMIVVKAVFNPADLDSPSQAT